MSAVALDRGQIGTIAVGLVIAIVVIGFLLGLVITALVGRLVLLVVVVLLGVLVWQQRTSLLDKLSSDQCHLNATFFGVHVQPPPDVVSACAKVSH